MNVTLFFLTYNRKGETIKCFQSIKPRFQDPDTRIVIWDNASRDGTPQWLMSLRDNYPNVDVILSGVNEGVAGARHQLFKNYSTGSDVVISLDSDISVFKSDWVDCILSCLNDPSVGICGRSGYFLAENWMPKQAPEGVTIDVDIISGYCQAFRTELIEKGLSPDLNLNWNGAEDDDLCFQVKDMGLRVVQNADISIRHRYAGTWDSARWKENRQKLKDKWEGRVNRVQSTN